MQSLRELPLMYTRFIPERVFDPIANVKLVVNHAEIIPNNMRIDAQLFSHLAVCEACCHQLYHALLLGARPSVLVSKGHGFLDHRSGLVDIFHDAQANPQRGDN
jgi:hypothetical protein